MRLFLVAPVMAQIGRRARVRGGPGQSADWRERCPAEKAGNKRKRHFSNMQAKGKVSNQTALNGLWTPFWHSGSR